MPRSVQALPDQSKAPVSKVVSNRPDAELLITSPLPSASTRRLPSILSASCAQRSRVVDGCSEPPGRLAVARLTVAIDRPQLAGRGTTGHLNVRASLPWAWVGI
jgi:hypothetical protein